MKCPKCGDALAPREVGDIVVDQCASCHGVWFDLGELPALIDFHKKHSDSPLLTGGEAMPVYDEISGPCPRCGGEGHMTRVTNLQDDELIMDSCPVCYGIWMDGGELQRVMERGVGFTIKSFFRDLLS